MTDGQLQALYVQGLGLSHIQALHLIFAAGYAAHAGISGVALGQGFDPVKTASVVTNATLPSRPETGDHG
jgi:hypothetical protein